MLSSRLLALTALTHLLSVALAVAVDERPGPVAYVTVVTGGMSFEFAGDRAWTISRISHGGKMITDRKGFTGTVVAPEGGRWIGTGHNEGGLEKIESAELMVDGKPCALVDQANYEGQRAILLKHSTLGALRLEATYIATPDGVTEQHRYEATEEVKIGTLYGFMHPFLPSTTEWLAEKPDGTAMSGVFSSDGGHSLTEDIKWAAVYDPTTQRVSLAWYPKPLVGQGLKSFFWEKTIYHKLYNQLYAHATLPAGAKFTAQMVLRCAEAKSESWKEKAHELVRQVEREYTAGEVRFSPSGDARNLSLP